jgi:hypothetical protein
MLPLPPPLPLLLLLLLLLLTPLLLLPPPGMHVGHRSSVRTHSRTLVSACSTPPPLPNLAHASSSAFSKAWAAHAAQWQVKRNRSASASCRARKLGIAARNAPYDTVNSSPRRTRCVATTSNTTPAPASFLPEYSLSIALLSP